MFAIAFFFLLIEIICIGDTTIEYLFPLLEDMLLLWLLSHLRKWEVLNVGWMFVSCGHGDSPTIYFICDGLWLLIGVLCGKEVDYG